MPSADLDGIVARLRGSGSVFAEDEAELLVAEARTPDELEAMVADPVTTLAARTARVARTWSPPPR